MIDMIRIDERGATLDGLDDMAFVDKEFSKEGPILPRDTAYQGRFLKRHGK